MDSKVDDWARKGGLGLGFRGYNTPYLRVYVDWKMGIFFTFFHGLFPELVIASSRSTVMFGFSSS